MTEANKQEPSRGFDISKLADANAKYQEQSEKIAKQFQDANSLLKSLQDAARDSGAFSAASELQDALSNGGLSDAMKATQGLSAHLDPLREHASTLAEAVKLVAPANDVLDQLRASGVHDRLSELSAKVTEGSRLADAIRGIEKQQHVLDSIVAPEPIVPNLDHLHIENPIVETNRKLDRIERRFSQISEIAHDSAQVATDLQAYAAEFLQKFERAAEDANQSGSKAIKVGWLALAIALVVGAGQVFAPTLLRDQEAEALPQSVVNLNAEISTLRAEQSAANDRLIEALASSDVATANALREALAAIVAQQVDGLSDDASATGSR